MKSPLKTLTLLALVVLLSGCPTVPTAQELYQPETISANGPYTQTATGMVFPTSVGAFQRAQITRYDAAGLDMSAGYNLISPQGTIVLTVYVYPSPQISTFSSPANVIQEARDTLALDHYAAKKREILRAHPNSSLVRESEITLPEGGTIQHGRLAVFTYDQPAGFLMVRSESRLYTFCYVADKWIVEYRITYPLGLDASQSIDDFLQHLPWTIQGI